MASANDSYQQVCWQEFFYEKNGWRNGSVPPSPGICFSWQMPLHLLGRWNHEGAHDDQAESLTKVHSWVFFVLRSGCAVDASQATQTQKFFRGPVA
ncbi:hypothetical protein YTPLAS18_33110 [Nitrospira sp.]|nr:hypothetical protein YTPLAS18_33110 [Nitrospira sp.]